jgi:cell division septation protein DedD
MRKRKKRRHPDRRKGTSMTRNVALLFLSLGLVVCACILYTSLFDRSDISLDPLQKALSGVTAQAPSKTPPAKTEPREPTQAASAYDYTFYQMLGRKDASGPIDDHYCIQVAAFRTEGQARELARSLREKTRLRFNVERRGRLHYVRWGSFASRENAEKQCARLAEKLQRECMVVRF